MTAGFNIAMPTIRDMPTDRVDVPSYNTDSTRSENAGHFVALAALISALHPAPKDKPVTSIRETKK